MGLGLSVFIGPLAFPVARRVFLLLLLLLGVLRIETREFDLVFSVGLTFGPGFFAIVDLLRGQFRSYQRFHQSGDGFNPLAERSSNFGRFLCD